jgi:hypothetical protein
VASPKKRATPLHEVYMFASQHTKNLSFSTEMDGVVNVRIRKLSHKSLALARTNKQAELIAGARTMGPDLLEAFMSGNKEKDAAAAVQAADGQASNQVADATPTKLTEEQKFNVILAQHDRPTVLHSGIVSIDPLPKLGTGNKTMNLREAIDDLEEEDAESIYRSLMQLAYPSKTENETARGNA